MATITTINSSDQINNSRDVINNNFNSLNTELASKQDSLDKATESEVNTGTNDDKYVTPKAIADSNYIKDSYLSSNNYQQIEVSSTEPSSPSTGDLWLDIS